MRNDFEGIVYACDFSPVFCGFATICAILWLETHSVGEIFGVFGKNLYSFGQFVIVVNGQILKNKIII